ncbi:HTH_Tnp_Tc3_2 domain-containing protein [Trichonephila clavipes]|nr:HTH_Tnp_Tc3_2 domain-containing protein [Trichonephila clavipes]
MIPWETTPPRVQSLLRAIGDGPSNFKTPSTDDFHRGIALKIIENSFDSQKSRRFRRGTDCEDCRRSRRNPGDARVISSTTISRMYRKYRESSKTSNLRHRCDRKRVMQERDRCQLVRTIKRDRRASHPQIAADFNAGPSTSVTMRTIQRNIIDMGFRGRRHARVPLLTPQHKALRLI